MPTTCPGRLKDSACRCLSPEQRRRRHHFSQTKIQHLHIAVKTHHDVFWLQIAMDDARTMGCAKRLQDLPCNLEAGLHGRCTFEPIAQSFAFYQLHHKIIGTDVVEGADMWMIEG